MLLHQGLARKLRNSQCYTFSVPDNDQSENESDSLLALRVWPECSGFPASWRRKTYRSGMPPKYLLVPVDTPDLLEKLSPLQPPPQSSTGGTEDFQSHFKAVVDWFRLLFLPVNPSNPSKALPVCRQGLSWEFKGRSGKYTFPSRISQAKKEKPHAVDCLALGRFLHAVQEYAEADYPQVLLCLLHGRL